MMDICSNGGCHEFSGVNWLLSEQRSEINIYSDVLQPIKVKEYFLEFACDVITDFRVNLTHQDDEQQNNKFINSFNTISWIISCSHYSYSPQKKKVCHKFCFNNHSREEEKIKVFGFFQQSWSISTIRFVLSAIKNLSLVNSNQNSIRYINACTTHLLLPIQSWIGTRVLVEPTRRTRIVITFACGWLLV